MNSSRKFLRSLCRFLLVYYLVAHAKFQNPTCLLFGKKVRASERKKEEEEKITPLIADNENSFHRDVNDEEEEYEAPHRH